METNEEHCSEIEIEIDLDLETRRATPRPTKHVTKYVNKWIVELHEMGLRFVTEPNKLIEQLRYFNGREMANFKTKFMREKDQYIHPTPVRIKDVLNKTTKIWTEQERQDSQRAIAIQNNPQGVDTCGNTETSRVKGLFELAGLTSRFKLTETVRGSLVDIIVTDLKTHKTFGLQIATAEAVHGQFNFTKIIADLLKCIEKNIVILLIAVVNGEIVGVYMIPPTDAFQKALNAAGCKESMYIQPSMLSKVKTSSKLNKSLEQFRFIRKSSQTGVKGDFGDLEDFPTKFQNICEEYPSIVNTPMYLSSLFVGVNQQIEWAGNVAYTENVVKRIDNFEQIEIHGQRGDMHLKYDDGKGTHTLDQISKLYKLKYLDLTEMQQQKTNHLNHLPTKCTILNNK